MTEKVTGQSDSMFADDVDNNPEPTLEPNDTPEPTAPDNIEPEPVDTKADTDPEPTGEPDPVVDPDADPEPAPTGEPDTDYNALMEELGLSKQFGNTESVLRQTPQMRAEITRLQQERADLLRTIQQQQPPPVQPEPLTPMTGDDFVDDPEAAIERYLQQKGYVPGNQVQQYVDSTIGKSLDDQQVTAFINSTPDFAEHEPAMIALVKEFPSIGNMPQSASYKFLYEIAKGRATAAATPQKPQVQPSPGAANKGRANTSGARSNAGSKPDVKGTGAEPTREQFEAMSLDELRKHHGYGDT